MAAGASGRGVLAGQREDLPVIEGAPAIAINAIVARQTVRAERRRVRLHGGGVGLAMARVAGRCRELGYGPGMAVSAGEGLAAAQGAVTGQGIAGRVVRKGCGVNHGQAGRRAAVLGVTEPAAIGRPLDFERAVQRGGVS